MPGISRFASNRCNLLSKIEKNFQKTVLFEKNDLKRSFLIIGLNQKINRSYDAKLKCVGFLL